jgi:formylglycine-generating enzyme required for sulfatase activity
MSAPLSPPRPTDPASSVRRRWTRPVVAVGVVVALGFGLWTLARYKVAIESGSGELWGLWDCDPSYITEGRPNLERVGCLVRLPDAGLRQALQPTPDALGNVDIFTFLMGAQATDPNAAGYDPAASGDESPPHPVSLSPFWLQRFSVSVRQYHWCVVFGPCSEDEVATGGYFTYSPRNAWDALLAHNSEDERPVTGVTWEAARTYCQWIDGRLPTEAEWEYAARGGALQRRFPWGDSDPTCGHAVFGGGAGGRCDVDGPTSASLHRTYGQDRVTNILHQAGNTWEWTADWYAEDYYQASPTRDPKGPEQGTGRVQRGGGWSDDDPEVLRGAFRAQMDPEMQMPDVSFRCAADDVEHHPYTTLLDGTAEHFERWEALGTTTRDGWDKRDGVLHSPEGDGPHVMWRPGAPLSETLLSARVYPTRGTGDSVAFVYGIQDAQNHYRAELHLGARVARIIRVLSGVEGLVAETSNLSLSPRGWITLNLDWRGGRHTFDLANQHLVSGDDSTWAQGDIGLQVSGHRAAIFDTVFTTP